MRCCHGIGARDRTCQAIFDRTRVLPCIPRRAEEGFGDCARSAFYTVIHHPAWDGAIHRTGLATAIAQGQTQIGRITVAPLVLPDGSPYDNDFVVRHALGHLCSDALRHSRQRWGESYRERGQNICCAR